MARVVYALSGQGRGSTYRGSAVAAGLRARGHEVRFCCSDTARSILLTAGENMIPVPTVHHTMHDNTVLAARTLLANWSGSRGVARIVDQLLTAFREWKPHLVISDFEPFSWRAADRLDLPCISLNHQQIATETTYSLPLVHGFHASVAKITFNAAPPNPKLILLPSFFFPSVLRPWIARLLPPILRTSILELSPTFGNFILVYFKEPGATEGLLDILQRAPYPCVLYNRPKPKDAARYPNIIVKSPSSETFQQDLARCRAVVCNAGFRLVSEALYLGKPVLCVPSNGMFEQTLNALFLEKEGIGKTVIGRHLLPDNLDTFIEESNTIAERLRPRRASGNNEAIDCIEEILLRGSPAVQVPGTAPSHPYAMSVS